MNFVPEDSLPKIRIAPHLRSIDRLLKDSLLLIYRQWAPVLLIQVIMTFLSALTVITGILIFLTPLALGLVAGGNWDDLLTNALTGTAWIGGLIMIVPLFIIMSWGMGSMIGAIGYDGGGMAPLGYTIKKGFKVLFPFFGLSVLSYLANIGAFVLLIFPMFILIVGLSLSWFIIVLEDDVSVFQAIGTSWKITKGYKWPIFGRSLLLFLIIWGAAFAFGMIGMVPFAGIVVLPAQFVFNFIITPYFLAYFYLIYEDIRSVRRDIYSMSGGVAAMMIVFWAIAVLSVAGAVFSVMYFLHGLVS